MYKILVSCKNSHGKEVWKEVWKGYRIFNLKSAKATAKIWREQHYDTETCPKMQVVKMQGGKSD